VWGERAAVGDLVAGWGQTTTKTPPNNQQRMFKVSDLLDTGVCSGES